MTIKVISDVDKSDLGWGVGMTEDEIIGWHYRLNGHMFEHGLGVGDGKGSLAVLQSLGWQRVQARLSN